MFYYSFYFIFFCRWYRESAPMCKDYCVIFNTWEGEYYGFIMNILCHYSPFHPPRVHGCDCEIEMNYLQNKSHKCLTPLWKSDPVCSSCCSCWAELLHSKWSHLFHWNKQSGQPTNQHQYENILLGPHPAQKIQIMKEDQLNFCLVRK